MRGRAAASLLGLALTLPAAAAEEPEWPALAAGDWALTLTPVRPGAKPLKLVRRLCRAPGEVLARYPGGSPVGRAGCRFSATRIDDSRYELRHECDLLKGGIGVASARVSVQGDSAFSAEWEVREGDAAPWRELQSGRLQVRGCQP